MFSKADGMVVVSQYSRGYVDGANPKGDNNVSGDHPAVYRQGFEDGRSGIRSGLDKTEPKQIRDEEDWVCRCVEFMRHALANAPDELKINDCFRRITQAGASAIERLQEEAQVEAIATSPVFAYAVSKAVQDQLRAFGLVPAPAPEPKIPEPAPTQPGESK